MIYRTVFCLVALILVSGGARASDVTFTNTFIADFEFDVLGGTSINPGPATGFLPYEAIGNLTFTVDSAINDPSQTSAAITNVTGTLNGVIPSFLVPYTISPIQFLTGDLTDIVRTGGKITSANVSDLSMKWDLVAGGGLTLFTVDGLPFNGSVSSIPFANGDQLSGAAQFSVYFFNGMTNELVAYGEDRTLTAVPEPSSAALGMTAVVALGAFVVRRRTRMTS